MTFTFEIPNHRLALRKTDDNRFFVETFDWGNQMNFQHFGFFDDIETADRFAISEIIDQNSQFDLDYSILIFDDRDPSDLDSDFETQHPYSVLDNSELVKTYDDLLSDS